MPTSPQEPNIAAETIASSQSFFWSPQLVFQPFWTVSQPNMICDSCQRILIWDTSQTGPIPVTTSRGHHLTCQSLKSSVDLGCYICHHFWTALKDNERELVSASAASGLTLCDSEVKALANKSTSKSAMNFITLSRLDDGGPYVRPGCYVLQLYFNSCAVPNLGVNVEGSFWCSAFVLQPCGGKLALRSY